MSTELPPLVPSERYQETEGKLAASIKWLVQRVYEHAIPDKLRHAVIRDDHGLIHMDEALISGLANGSLYSQAASKIFKESHLVTQSHGAILAALADYGITVVQQPEEGGLPVTEEELSTESPFHPLAHLAMIDALMLAHLRSVVTVERVVEAVSRHTSVDERERPMDSADALLFWINKICLLVRDDVERDQIMLKGDSEEAMIPEMEDLYDEMSDGQCLCTVVHFYRPKEMDIQEICFNEKMSNSDCQYNLLLLKNFCDHSFPMNPFHMDVEDLLYLRDSLQMNVNVFLADLFDLFEPAPITPPQPSVVQSPRRFVPIHAIPDLRAANQAARSPHPPRVRNPFHNIQVTQSPTRSMSVMSQDSLFTNRTQDTWRRNPDQWGANVTNFGRLQTCDNGSNGSLSQAGQYTRSDSLPAASVRLQLEEKRREHEKRKLMQSSMSEAERAEKSKAAFFAVMNGAKQIESRPTAQDQTIAEMQEKMNMMASMLEQLQMTPQQRMNRATSQPSVYHEAPPHSARPDFAATTLPHGATMAPHDGFGQYPQVPPQQQQPFSQSPLRASLSNGMLNYMPPNQPYDYQPQMPGQMSMNGYGYQMMPQQVGSPSPMMHQSAHASTGFALPHAMSPMMPPHQPPMHMQMQMDNEMQMGFQQYPPQRTASSVGIYSYPSQQPPPAEMYRQPSSDYPTPNQEPEGFVLHSHDASSSRADPQLELNRNLTNWGMTMKMQPGPGRMQRGTWENQTFIKNERDLVNHPELVPVVQDEDSGMQQRRSPSQASSVRRSRESRDSTSMSRDEPPEPTQNTEPDTKPVSKEEQSSPPRDPGSSAHNGNNSTEAESSRPAIPSGPAPAFIVNDDQAASDFDKIAEQRREAKRAALLAKTMKRKEEIGNKPEQIDQRTLERRLIEEAKKEAAEQRKIEKEIQRQKIFEDYKRKKAEKELGIEPSSARYPPGRGSSQPPFVRAKSQMSDSIMGRNSRPRGSSTVENKVTVASLQEPTHKLFAKATPKSNRGLILNALQYSIFPGPVNNAPLTKTMGDLAGSSSKHFLVLFRDHKLQFRGLYTWDQQSDTVEKISGQGPTKCTETMMNLMFKYDSGNKTFSQIPTKHISATIDAFSIQDSFWQKPKIPHSGTASHRNN